MFFLFHVLSTVARWRKRPRTAIITGARYSAAQRLLIIL